MVFTAPVQGSCLTDPGFNGACSDCRLDCPFCAASVGGSSFSSRPSFRPIPGSVGGFCEVDCGVFCPFCGSRGDNDSCGRGGVVTSGVDCSMAGSRGSDRSVDGYRLVSVDGYRLV